MDDLVMISPMMPDVIAAITQNFAISRYWEADDKDAFLAAHRQTRFLVTDGYYGCSAAIMDQMPRLEIIACNGVGTDAIDLEAAKLRGICVTNTPGVLSDAVAELALGLMLGLCRRIVDADQFIRDAKWPAGGYQSWSRDFGPAVKMDRLMRETIHNDETKNHSSHCPLIVCFQAMRGGFQGQGCA